MFPHTTKVIRESKEEIRQRVDEVVSFTISNIFMNLVRIVFAFWMPVLRFLAFPLNFARWIKHQLIGRSKDRLLHQTRHSGKCCCHGPRNKAKRKMQIESNEGKQISQEQLCKAEIKGKKLQVVLDLDNTLIHSLKRQPQPGDPQCFTIKDFSNPIISVQTTSADSGSSEISVTTTTEIVIQDETTPTIYEHIYVYKRPYLDQFLTELSKISDVHLFTASNKDYADQIISVLDPQSVIFKKRFYRDDCDKDITSKTIFKRLEVVQEDLHNLVMVDDSPITFEKNKLNTFKIQHWRMSLREDTCLKACLKLLQQVNYSIEKRSVQESLTVLSNFNREWHPYHY
ncbi:hypothetical protein FGO68_gene11684 [Halteria grandinella]|uniref:Mitochondrial import inner membrane translocase subunit TIM50 n=1 Tax=Halteria grandinella TaxID=5974 RepID=A0A8J8P7X0_HALGN|nr:hypothetical protein FGO68_gene11684 [Halteria grandinella]